MLRNALMEMRDDHSAVMSLLSFQADNGAWWVQSAHAELRLSLVQGRLSDAETIGELIGTVLHIQENGADDELAENRIHREAMRWLMDGIGAIMERDVRTGIAHLENLTGAFYSQESLQWVAWFWVSRGSMEAGELDKAAEAAEQSLTLAERLDPQARSIGLRNMGEIAFLQGDHDKAFEHITQAGKIFSELNDPEGEATTHLVLARMEARAGKLDQAVQSAERAKKAAPEWSDPVIFLARQALIAEDVGKAAAHLYPFTRGKSPTQEILKEQRLVELLQTGQVAPDVMSEFCKLLEEPPSNDVIDRLKALRERAPEFARLVEFLGWTLIKLGRDEEAAPFFEELAGRDLDQELQASVLLGLGCLANRRNRNKRPAARLSSAAKARLSYKTGPEYKAVGGAVAEPTVQDGGGPSPRLVQHESGPSPRFVQEEDPEMLDSQVIVMDLEQALSGDLTEEQLEAAFGKSTVQQSASQRENMIRQVIEAAPPASPSLDFTPALTGEGEPAQETNGVVALDGAQVDESEVIELSDSEIAFDAEEPAASEREMARNPTSNFVQMTKPPVARVDAQDPMPNLSTQTGAMSAPAAGEAKAAFTGDLQLLAVPDLLEFLKTSRRTGTLVVTSEENGVGAISLISGMISGAASPNSPQLGDLLREGGAITEEQLAEATSVQKENPDQLLGTILVREGLVEEQVLQSALNKQVIGALIEMVDWNSGRFAFEPERSGAQSGEVEILLDTQGVLLDALREYDEKNR
jgi:tetratricopeptide (TPR) repeat protein